MVLACAMLGRAFDAFPHPDAAYVPFVLAMYVLPAWYASGWRRGPWMRRPGVLLAAQAVLTVVPFAIFGTHWVGGVSGLLAGLVLLLLPSRAAVPAYALLVGLEIALWLVVGLPYEPRVNSVTWLLVAFANQSLILYGLSRLADHVDALDADRDALAGLEVTQQRLAATTHLRETVQTRLHRIAERIEAALDAGSAERTRELISEAGRSARDAAEDVRRLVVDLPESTLRVRPGRPGPVAPRLARAITVAMLLLFAAQYLVNVIVPVAKPRPGVLVDLAAVLVAAVVVLLQLRHSTTTENHRPGAWPLTLALLAALCLAFYPTTGASSLNFLAFLAASGLLLIRHWSRWLLLGAVVLGLPVLALADPAPEPRTLLETITWATYAGATVAAASLLIFGLARLTQTAAQLEEVQEQIAAAARVRERLRLARDAHDKLGLGLSTIGLKTDLVAALAGQDRARSRREAIQALHLARLVATDVDAVSGDRVTFSVATEVATARQSLAAADLRAEFDVDPDLPDLDAVAAVLREAVTNVLRHSRATCCRIRLTRTGETITLVVTNDGVTPATGGEPGHGLTNMSERLSAVHGSLNTRIDGEEFTLTAMVPSAQIRAVSQALPA
ncbi:sensor histidine kinase [Paractinoplanes globisporus]|uniref:Sensor histidine kinase n=1 Tax=Paractinoplanes globisporus TaxID=113565 RepID=A0ABW6W955_9ACTN|nr:histidine kinase [Actinoplanes globisporus]